MFAIFNDDIQFHRGFVSMYLMYITGPDRDFCLFFPPNKKLAVKSP